MPKSKKDNVNEENQSNKEEQNIKYNIINDISRKINIQEISHYNPFNPIQNNNSIENFESNNSNKNESDNNKLSPINRLPEIIDINSSSNQSEYGNVEEEWNSSNERKKEKLKKDLLEKNNQSNNEDWGSEILNSNSNNKKNSDEWVGNSGEWGSKSNDKINNKEKVIDSKNNNELKNSVDDNKMEIDNDIREDKGPLPNPKQTEDTFANYILDKNKKDNELKWFNRDGRNPKDEYYENNIKKIMIEHEKQIKRREDKISELESLEFRMYYVKVNSEEEPKLLHDTKRPRIRFQNLNKVPEQLRKNIDLLQYDYLTPIQRAIMPYIQVGKDIVCVAETGSGKTLSYLFPIIGQMLIEGVPENPYISKKESLEEKKENKVEEENKGENNEKEENKDKRFKDNIAYPLCLIMAPSRELVLQISKESKKLAMDTGIKTVALIGGEKRNYQYLELSKGCDIIVSTPLRLYDFLKSGKIGLQMVKYLILDEAEKMLEPDFYEQLKNIFDKLPKRKFRQNLLFSATFNEDVKGIAKYCLNNYYYFCPLIECPKQIKHEFFNPNNGEEKIEILLNFLKKEENKNKSILIFMNSKKDVESLNKILEAENIKSCTIHGNKTQNDRNKSIKEFSLGYKNILISTDLISRGIDFPNVYCVINYNMPNNIDDYIHRVGRTGRLGQKGLALTYLDNIDDTNKEKLVQLLNNLGQEVPSWINDIQFKRFHNFSDNGLRKGKINNNDWGNDENDNNRNNFKKNNNKKWNKKDNNFNKNWERDKDDNDGWGKANKNNGNDNGWNDNKNDDWGNSNNNDNKKDDWGSSNNEDNGWGKTIRNNDKKWNDNKKDDWGSSNNDDNGWGNNERNKEVENNYKNSKKNKDNEWGENSSNDWGINDNKKMRNNDNGWGDNNSNNIMEKNKNRDNWRNNDNNLRNNNLKKRDNNNNDWGNSGNNNGDEWGRNDENKGNFENRGRGKERGKGRDENRKNSNFDIPKDESDNIEIPDDAYEELFVMGISYNSDEEELKKTFSKYGEVIYCKILKNKETNQSRGIGFVKFNDKKGAVKSMNDADNLICDGRNLRIRYSNNKEGEIKGKKGFREKRNDFNNNNNDWGNNNNKGESNFNERGRNNNRGGRGRNRGRGNGRGRGGRDKGSRDNFNTSWNDKKDDWGNNNNDGWTNNKNDGWENQNSNNNDGWGNQNNEINNDSQNKNINDGWGNKKNENSDNGWGNNNNDNGWGNNNNDNGWGNNNNDNGWGNQNNIKQKENNDDNWGRNNNRERSRDKDKDLDDW